MKATEITQEVRGRLAFIDESGKEVDSVEVAMPAYYLKSVLRAARTSTIQDSIMWEVPVEALEMNHTQSAATARAKQWLAVHILNRWDDIRDWMKYGGLSRENNEHERIWKVLESLVSDCHLMVSRLAEAGEIPTEELNKRE